MPLSEREAAVLGELLDNVSEYGPTQRENLIERLEATLKHAKENKYATTVSNFIVMYMRAVSRNFMIRYKLGGHLKMRSMTLTDHINGISSDTQRMEDELERRRVATDVVVNIFDAKLLKKKKSL